MDINIRICKLHNNDVTHICIFKGCKYQQRWCCMKCMKQRIHEHGLQDSTYVVQYQEFRIKKLELILKLYRSQLLAEGFNLCEQLFSLINEQQYLFEQQMEKMEKDKEILQTLISDLNEQNFILLDSYRIYEIVNVNLYQFFYDEKQFIDHVKNLFENVSQLQSIINKYQLNLNSIDNSFDLRNNYTIKQIDQIDYNSKSYCSSEISNNEKYLAYGDEYKNFKIYDITNNKIVKQFKVDQCIFACQFTSDSSQLYAGSGKGFVYGYNSSNNFKMTFRQYISKSRVLQIKTINNKHLITSTVDGIIKKIDIKRKKQIFKLFGLRSHFVVFDYNISDDMIIIGNGENFSIKLWKCQNKNMIIVKHHLHSRLIKQIQFINHCQNVLSLDQEGILCKWRINLIQKDPIKIQQFTQPSKIMNFCQINQNQNLLLICGAQIIIMNQEGQTIYTLNFKDQLQEQKSRQYDNQSQITCFESKQLDSARYIIVRWNNKVQLAVAEY